MVYSPKQGTIEPYRVGAGPHLFADWRYIRPGQIRWEGKGGKDVSLFATENMVEADHIYYSLPLDMPFNICIASQPAEKVGPLISPTYPWERLVFWPTLLYDGGKYRLWYEAVPDWYWKQSVPLPGAPRHPGWGNLLCYAESDDLEHWTKPKLGLMEYEGQATNIVWGGAFTQQTGFHGAGIFIDPSAPSASRYKMLYMGKTSLDQLAELERKRGPADPLARYYESAIYGAISSDGLHWHALPEPVMLANSDTGNVVYFDTQLNKYVGYFRMWLYGRRAIGRSETDDFGCWPLPEPVLWPRVDCPASSDLYTNAKSLYPKTTDQHLMFPAWYLRDTDRTEVHLATSQEGIWWSLVPGGPVLVTGEEGAWDSGCLFVGSGLVSTSDHKVATPYVGYAVPHKYPRSIVLGEIGLAIWPAERLAALKADGEGRFTTPPLIFNGRELCLNLATARAGEIRVEVAAAEEPIRPVQVTAGSALPELTFDACDPLWGNRPRAIVTWRGKADLSAYAGRPIVLRFRMRAAKLFAFSFET